MFKKYCGAVVALVLVFGVAGCGKSSEDTAEQASGAVPGARATYPEEVPLLKLPEGVTPTHYALDLRLDPDADGFSGTVSIDLKIDETVFFFYMHGEEIHVSSAKLITAKEKTIGAQYHQVADQGVARISLDRPVAPGAYRLELTFTASYSQRLDGIYKVGYEGSHYLVSQMQSISARHAFPCFDEPRFKTPFDVTLHVPSGDVAVTNGAEVSVETDDAGGSTYRFATTQPLATEILAFGVGPFDVVAADPLPVSGVRDRLVPLRGFAPKGHGAELEYILGTTAPLIAFYEDYFQQPYPFAKLDLIAAPEFQAGAMENAGAIMYGTEGSLVEATTPPGTLTWVLGTHAHEVAHQWFGNLVTPQWWDDIWLNESFADWISAKAVDVIAPEMKAEEYTAAAALAVMPQDSLAASRRLREPIATHDDISSIWDAISYSKGAGVLNMFEAYVGPEAFREGIRLHMRRFAGSNADAYDFLQSLSDGAGDPQVADAMTTFLTQAGVPMLDLQLSCTGAGATLHVAQSRSLPLGSHASRDVAWSVPLCYRTDEGEACHLVTRPEEEISLGPDCPSYLMPNRDSKGYYLWSLDDAAFQALVSHLDALSNMEKLAVLESIGAAYKGGLMSGQEVIARVSPLAADGDLRVVNTSAEILTLLDDYWGDAPDKPDFNRIYKDLFNEQFVALGLEANTPADLADPYGASDLRSTLIEIFAERVRDPALRAKLRDFGEIYVGFQNPEGAQPTAVSRQIALYAVEVAHEELGPDYGQVLLTRLGSASVWYEREVLLAGLAASQDKEFGATLIADLLGGAMVQSSEALTVAYRFMDNDVLQEDMLTYLSEENHLAELAGRLPVDEAWYVFGFGNDLCSAKGKAEFEAVVSGRTEAIFGAPRAIDQTTEQIDQCIAVRAHLQEGDAP